MQLFVKGESLHTINLTENETVGQLKGMLSSMENIPIEEQVLSYGGVMLEDEDHVSELVLPGGTLELTGRLYGGEATLCYPDNYLSTSCMYRKDSNYSATLM